MPKLDGMFSKDLKLLTRGNARNLSLPKICKAWPSLKIDERINGHQFLTHVARRWSHKVHAAGILIRFRGNFEFLHKPTPVQVCTSIDVLSSALSSRFTLIQEDQHKLLIWCCFEIGYSFCAVLIFQTEIYHILGRLLIGMCNIDLGA